MSRPESEFVSYTSITSPPFITSVPLVVMETGNVPLLSLRLCDKRLGATEGRSHKKVPRFLQDFSKRQVGEMQRTAADIHFEHFRLDVGNECLWREGTCIKLTPKAFALLRYFLEHAGRLVTKETLWQAIWQGTAVTDAALTMCLSEIRKALGDNAKTPRYIETVHRRGYRFIAPLLSTPPVPSAESLVPSPPPTPNAQHSTPFVVGRETELAHLQDCLAKAVDGERQLVFLTGEPGIGKTTLIEAFLAQLESGENSPVPSSSKNIVRGPSCSLQLQTFFRLLLCSPEVTASTPTAPERRTCRC